MSIRLPVSHVIEHTLKNRYRVPTGQGKLEKNQGICVGRESQEKVRKNIIFEKSERMILDHADYRYLWFFVSINIKKQANLQLPLNVQKLEVFQLQGELHPLTLWPGFLLFAYCSVNTVSLPYDIKYHFWHLCDRVIISIRSGKLSFYDWKSEVIVREFCYRRPVGTM